MGKDFNQIIESSSEQEFVALGKSSVTKFYSTPNQDQITDYQKYLSLLKILKYFIQQYFNRGKLSFILICIDLCLIIFKVILFFIITLLTAPLVATHVSLQLSVLPYKSSFGDTIEQDLKALSKVNDLNVHDRRKYELLIRSGATGTNKPFRAPAYSGYMDVFRGLSNQGLLGFYKGNFMGLMYNLCNSQLRFKSIDILDQQNYKFYSSGDALTRGVSMFAICSVIDIICQPLMTIQSRFILQNRLPNFALYKNLLDVVKRHKSQPLELYRAALGHIAKNGVLGLTWALYDKENAKKSYIISTLAGHICSYPIFTAIRRVQCQSTLPGMIPKRYTGTFNAIKVIAQEEGIKGLYRGFIAYAVANTFLNSFVIFSNSFMNGAEE